MTNAMNKKNIILGMLFSIPILVISYRSTYALFSSSVSNTNNTFSASASFPTVTPSVQIVINEISSDGNNKKEWAELYNPTGTSIDLSGWLIGNGALNDPLPAGSIISAGGYAVIIPSVTDVAGIPSSAATFQLSVNQIGNGFTDAGDAIVLKNTTSTIIDQLSYGTDTTIFPTPPASPGSGQSLARSPNGFDADIAGDWVIDSTPTIGQANL
ncbi:hypothetical protein A3D80_02695 [Candidatus Roizmanbacteria bacterium RIFCSPHIGHO2_02_FULL_40_13b]|nr:MAG: hypothetical protein A3D80_02695 [Candidatus Roizmanbacteria bacterium RIFCSPHIGHO2_02_FULL_40_13b]OGK49513.1 MAG: hypothetical protein A3A56_02700 [Candidatus Roizmanbacteria bacterium RIFCSPLOWO2_01_FULL_40_32]OGK57539.1 MAG: hypothetical protein A3H83_03215 [Candidatus Roizmanbacteria bacterium RIFCSPLOWO2_02_FULL_39_8]